SLVFSACVFSGKRATRLEVAKFHRGSLRRCYLLAYSRAFRSRCRDRPTRSCASHGRTGAANWEDGQITSALTNRVKSKKENISLYRNSDFRYVFPVPHSSGGAMRIVTFRWARDAMAAGTRQVTRSPGRNA